jgi:hypothetical protein
MRIRYTADTHRLRSVKQGTVIKKLLAAAVLSAELGQARSTEPHGQSS